MSLHVLGDDSASVIERMRAAILAAVECEDLVIESGSPGHYVIRAVSHAFADLNRVKQQQLVYGAIADLMKGDDAPVHAIDRLECIKP
ncbi:MAG: BolA/IbaG family iron-sulfur metabolism protein [Myxococcota bacterium]|jgi:acid stress-induced BolA-like protein IbaG/YrbA|nr:BolA/IbaG family iron-sulfur metabolism protein [Myxococcota bacterium]HIG68531.1 BolA/IbaG family iron-sulfur metabolism protein [Myxococcales bacterium]HIM00463.1 BolA/IbaG family iron-sulfur metabolism protein [Myxococcales bacterium]